MPCGFRRKPSILLPKRHPLPLSGAGGGAWGGGLVLSRARVPATGGQIFPALRQLREVDFLAPALEKLVRAFRRLCRIIAIPSIFLCF